MLNGLETAGDLLSGSECSSLAASPTNEFSALTVESRSRGRQHECNEKSPLVLRNPDPIDVVRDFLNRMKEPQAAKKLFDEDAKVDFYSAVVRGEDKRRKEKRGTPQTAQGGLNVLLASYSSCDIEIDSIFAWGEDVAAFGHMACSDGPSSRARDGHFSIWARVNVVRRKIAEFRWLDQVVRAEDALVHRHR
jgi:hypothetical protein